MQKIWSRAEHIASLKAKKPIGVILSRSMEIMSVYDDGNGNPLIKTWVDASDDGLTNRYIWFDVTKILLKNLLESHIDFRTFEENPSSFQYHVVTVAANGRSSFPAAVTRDELPETYWAKDGVLFDPQETDDVPKLYRKFSLNEVRESDLEEVKSESKMLGHGVFYLHITKGKGVGYGLIDTFKLAHILNRINVLYREARLDLSYTATRGDLAQGKKNEDKTADVSTDVRVFKRASFGIMLVPREANLFSREKIDNEAVKVFELLNTVVQNEGATKLLQEWSPFTVDAYQGLLKTVIDERMEFDFSWVKSEEVIRYDITHDEAFELQKKIKAVEVHDITTSDERGFFTRLHTDTGYFQFETVEGAKYNGHLETLIKPNAGNLKFRVLYSVRIQKTLTKKADMEGSPSYLILSAYEIKDETSSEE